MMQAASTTCCISWTGKEFNTAKPIEILDPTGPVQLTLKQVITCYAIFSSAAGV